MTITEFMAALAQTPRVWKLQGKKLRTPACGCPISALRLRHEDCVWFVASDLGLSESDAIAIVGAADGTVPHPALRRQLFAACGLRQPRARRTVSACSQ